MRDLKPFISIFFAALAVAPSVSQSQSSDRPIRLVIPFAPGGAADGMGRVIGKQMSEKLGQPVIVDNKPGAATKIAVDFVAKAPPDGHTVLLASSSIGLLHLRKSAGGVDARTELAPISLIAESPYVIVANPSAPYKTLPAMIAYAKANPGKVSYGMQGVGSSTHLVGELFNRSAGISTVAVPYKGSGPVQMALLAGEVPIGFDGIGPTTPAIKEGRLVALATTGKKRSAQLETTPVAADAIPGFEAYAWYGLMTTRGAPKAMITRLNEALHAALQSPEVKEKMTALSVDLVPGTPEEFTRVLNADVERWTSLVRAANITLE